MCSISGIIDFNFVPQEEILRRMLVLLRHRGPEASGIYRSRYAGLASNRLSIIDLPGGDQPIHNEDRTIWVIYNGEVYNYPELRQGLEACGHRFYTQTDTEILVHLYEDKGPEFIRDLNGQFAFALWDCRSQHLVLGRDRLGVRPLFCHQGKGRLVFGSEIKAIFADPEIARKMNVQALGDVFTCWAPLGEETAFEGIFQLLPGHYALFSRDGLAIRRYWQLTFPEKDGQEDRPLSFWAQELEGLLHDATRIRLRADVPVGAYLSGGLDSTYISSLVKRNFNNRLCTFSVTFSDERYDETSFQKTAILFLGTEHRNIFCHESDIGEVFPEVIWHAEVPLLRTAPAPLFLLSRLVRDSSFKVVLTGEGSDEIFGGYDIFKEDRIRRFWARRPSARMGPLLVRKLYPDIFSEEVSRSWTFLEGFFRKGLAQVDSPAYSHMVRWQNTAGLKGFFSRNFRESIDGHHQKGFVDRYIAALPGDFMRWHPLSRAQYTEITIFFSNYLLSSQGDRMAMAHSVEGRFPFLDHRVVEFACRIPPRYRLMGLKEKYILRRIAEGLIPSELAHRPKRPYRAPISRCFLMNPMPDYVQELLSEESLNRTRYFDSSKVKQLLEKGRKQAGFLLSERENMAIVGILSMQLLHDQFIHNFPPIEIGKYPSVKIYDQREDRGPGRKLSKP